MANIEGILESISEKGWYRIRTVSWIMVLIALAFSIIPLFKGQVFIRAFLEEAFKTAALFLGVGWAYTLSFALLELNSYLGNYASEIHWVTFTQFAIIRLCLVFGHMLTLYIQYLIIFKSSYNKKYIWICALALASFLHYSWNDGYNRIIINYFLLEF